MPRPFELRRRVQFAETDLIGVVHFSWYFRYMEEAEYALWRACGLTIASLGDTVRFPRTGATCDYRAPLRFEDEFVVSIQIAAMGSRNIKYACRLTRGDVLVATGTLTATCVAAPAGAPLQSIEIPEHISGQLAAYQ